MIHSYFHKMITNINSYIRFEKNKKIKSRSEGEHVIKGGSEGEHVVNLNILFLYFRNEFLNAFKMHTTLHK